MTELDFPPTHIQYSNGSIVTWRQYAIPERTWLVLHDAMRHGSWSDDWLSRMAQSKLHPDVPTISEVNAQLVAAGVSEATLRDLVFLVAALVVEVEDEAKFMTRIERIVFENYEPFRPYLSEYNPDEDEDEDDDVPLTMPILRTVQPTRQGVPPELMVGWMALVVALLVLILQR